MVEPFVIAVVGAGGKTSLLRRLAGEAREEKKKVLVMTTTHMLRPSQYGIFSEDYDKVKKALATEGLAVVGIPAENNKIKFLGGDFYERVCPLADLVLVEADGAKHYPVKVPAAHEPVIPANATMILSMAGLSAWGKPLKEVCFRAQEAQKLLQSHLPQVQWGSAVLNGNILGCLLQYGYVEPLRAKYPYTLVVPVLNQADTEEAWERGQKVLSDMREPDGWIMGNLHVNTYAQLF